MAAMSRILRHCALVLSLAAAAPASLAAQGRNSPDPQTIRAAVAECRAGGARLPPRPVGISDPHALDPAVIDLIAQTGVKWVRAEFHWSRIEPKPGAGYRWAAYDRMVAQFSQRGIQVLAILTYIPEGYGRNWAAIDKGFQAFATAAVQRYARQGVHHWEIFNEPNLPGYGWLSKSDSASAHLGAYALLLARANRAIRRHDPAGVVVLGGLASDQHRGMAAESVMRELYALGIARCFDVMAYHPYGYQNRFPAARARIDRILEAAGDGGKPVWFTEYGWTDFHAMDQRANATAQTNPMMAAFSQLGASDGFFWFAAKDYSARRNAPTFGLASFDLEKRPSFETFRRLVSGLDR
ncbi:cellulase family glycosylhydrolase [Paracoccus ravus]|uniref:cellulase family glycosylhydrolase n=1 Tax=Paracoccus ravus TaxID=2447760 RepID=UPI00106EEA8C|nr:cellulase family glycosylhydrolase [Paracoccus ravus]